MQLCRRGAVLGAALALSPLLNIRARAWKVGKMPRDSRRKHGVNVTVDDILLQALEGGPVTVKDIVKRVERRVRVELEKRVRVKLDKLRVRGIVLREGRGGPHREFTYKFLRPDLAAKALGEEGSGLSRTARVTQERRSPDILGS